MDAIFLIHLSFLVCFFIGFYPSFPSSTILSSGLISRRNAFCRMIMVLEKMIVVLMVYIKKYNEGERKEGKIR